ncbi:MAG: hypothetical protein KC457_09380 [Myxococcales bacterium]|nr:hypothetical protein [Myxococcales bacterium]
MRAAQIGPSLLTVTLLASVVGCLPPGEPAGGDDADETAGDENDSAGNDSAGSAGDEEDTDFGEHDCTGWAGCEDCTEDEVCGIDGYTGCEHCVPAPPPNCELPELVEVPLSGDLALSGISALTFFDLDGDLRDELIVADQVGLHSIDLVDGSVGTVAWKGPRQISSFAAVRLSTDIDAAPVLVAGDVQNSVLVFFAADDLGVPVPTIEQTVALSPVEILRYDPDDDGLDELAIGDQSQTLVLELSGPLAGQGDLHPGKAMVFGTASGRDKLALLEPGTCGGTVLEKYSETETFSDSVAGDRDCRLATVNPFIDDLEQLFAFTDPGSDPARYVGWVDAGNVMQERDSGSFRFPAEVALGVEWLHTSDTILLLGPTGSQAMWSGTELGHTLKCERDFPYLASLAAAGNGDDDFREELALVHEDQLRVLDMP